ncbi:MAG: aminomethyl transferase family protein, partial [Actinobacteria bacterium]|nr:aminomethyl transferase family protein [Actinomycetota bacterium]NIT95067.1 aminomethyl transferase family protein [Actinomycetota bacterium]NIV55224.1 hypothetical protein [Actinomycetota bacterium]NIX50052.1 hypothetical protein [Actinomycetota bacterium]
DHFFLTAAEPNLAYFLDLVGGLAVTIEDESDDYGVLAVQGPASRTVLATLAPGIAELPFFAHTEVDIAGCRIMVSRTGFTGDLGYELWVPAGAAGAVWDAVLAAGAGRGVIPVGHTALLMCRIEAGLLLLDTDFQSSRFAWNDAHRSTPLELGFGWMFRDVGSRTFIGRRAIIDEIENGTSRWNMVGVVVDWKDYDLTHDRAGLIAPKDHVPSGTEMMLYDDERRRVGYTSSFMYSPVLQKHIAIARVHPELAAPGSRVNIEVTIDHAYE